MNMNFQTYYSKVKGCYLGKNIGGRDNPCAEYEEAAPRNMFRMGIAGCRDFFRGKMTGRRGRLDARAHSP